MGDEGKSDYQKRRKKVEAVVEDRFEQQRKAIQIVERLSEIHVDKDFFTSCAKFLLPSHYSDVVEERSIDKLCGYPLCTKPLNKMTPQKYHISLNTNKVYDLTERRCFCSQFCFRASKYYQAQMPASPLWSRSDERFEDIKLLEMDAVKPVDEPANSMIVRLRAQPDEIEKPVKEDKTETIDGDDLLEDVSILSLHDSNAQRKRFNEFEMDADKGIKEHRSKVINDGDESSLYRGEKGTPESHSCRKEESSVNNKSESSKEKCSPTRRFVDEEESLQSKRYGSVDGSHVERRTQTRNDLNATVQEPGKAPTVVLIFQNVRKCLLEWRTKECLIYLKVLSKPTQEKENDIDCAESKLCEGVQLPAKRKDDTIEGEGGNMKVKALDEMPVLTGKEDTRNEGGVVSYAGTNPVPDISQLKQDTDFFSLKVKQFYSLRPDKKLQPSAKVERPKKKKSTDIEKVNESTRLISLPLVDSKSQMSLRRSILLDKIHKVLRDLLPPLEVTVQDISSDLRDLVATFNLSSHNITFKPAGWTLVAICLLHLLALRQTTLEARLTAHSTQRFLAVLWQQYGITNKDINRLVKEFTNITGVVK